MHLQLIRHIDLLEGFRGEATQGTAIASLVQLVLFKSPIDSLRVQPQEQTRVGVLKLPAVDGSRPNQRVVYTYDVRESQGASYEADAINHFWTVCHSTACQAKRRPTRDARPKGKVSGWMPFLRSHPTVLASQAASACCVSCHAVEW